MRDSNVRYFDVTGKHCPSYLMNTQKRADFKKRLEMDHTPSPAHEEGVEWAIENGPLQGNAEGDLMLSVTREQIVCHAVEIFRLERAGMEKTRPRGDSQAPGTRLILGDFPILNCSYM